MADSAAPVIEALPHDDGEHAHAGPILDKGKIMLPSRVANQLLQFGIRTDAGQALLVGFMEGHPDLDPEHDYAIEVPDGWFERRPPSPQQNGRRR